MAKSIVKSINDGKSVNLQEFEGIVSTEFPSHHLEDLPENNFTENSVFFGGNFIVTPGITTHGAEIFRSVIESIFIFKNNLPPAFKANANHAITWILELSKRIFERVALRRYQFEEDESDEIRFPSSIVDYSFSGEEIEFISEEYELSTEILSNFCIDPNDILLDSSDPENNPLIERPLMEVNGRIYFILPSAQLSAINEYLLRKAEEFGCQKELVKVYNERIWIQMLQRFERMGWVLTDIDPPTVEINLASKEIVCKIDDNKLAYVCYLGATANGKHTSGMEDQAEEPAIPTLNERLNTVSNYLKTREGLEDHEILTLILFGDIGRSMMLAFNRPEAREERMWFSAFDFIRLVDHEEWDILSIWRFAKAYRITAASTTIIGTSMLDIYWLYKSNEQSFYSSDKARPNFLNIVPGTGSEITRLAIKNEELHGAPIDKDGVRGHYYVKRAFEYAPVYKPIERISSEERLLECFDFPVWIFNRQVEKYSDRSIAINFINAVTFWLYKLRSYLHQLSLLGTEPFYIELILDGEYFKDKHVTKIDTTIPIEFKSHLDNRTLEIHIPFTLSNSLRLGDNSGERLLMINLLNTFNQVEQIHFVEEAISEMIDEFIPLGPAKMILFTDTGKNIEIDPRWLIPNRYVSDGEIAIVLDELAALVKIPIAENVEGTASKVKTCNAIVHGLITKLRNILSEYDSTLLVKRLILIHEGYVNEREYRKIHIPAKIACFSDIEEEVHAILGKDKRLVNSTLSIRCLIEFVAAEPKLSGKKPNFGDIDQMLAIMHEIVNWGFLSDAIHLGLDDTEMGLLPSGRIGTNKGFYNEKLKPYNEVRATTEIENYIGGFSRHFEERRNSKSVLPGGFQQEVDDAFKLDWGISLGGVLGICEVLSIVAEQNQKSVMEMPADQLFSKIKTHTYLSDEEIKCGIEKLSLRSRLIFDRAPQGYGKNDIYPWKYNREFAFLRRPLVVIINERGDDVCYWGLRNSHAAGGQILNLLHSGRLKTYGHTNIESILGKINIHNGDIFRDEVKDWFKNQEDFITIDHEVTIEPGGHIEAEKNYGDIDIFTIDQTNGIVYSIECKDTDQPKNIHEIKNELDKYLGKNKGEGLVKMHVERDKYLRRNKEKMTQLSNPSDYVIMSLILTSEDLPLSYIEDKLPLPFISFPQLKRMGTGILKTLC